MRYFASAAGVPLDYVSPGDVFFDASEGVDCEVSELMDATKRCVPSHAYETWTSGLYRDSDCTQHIVGRPSGACAFSSYALVWGGGDVPRIETVRRLGAELTDLSRGVFQRVDGACRAVTADASWTYYDVGDEVVLARVTEQVD